MSINGSEVLRVMPETNVDSIIKARQAFEAWGFEALYRTLKDEPRDWPPLIVVHSMEEETDSET